LEWAILGEMGMALRGCEATKPLMSQKSSRSFQFMPIYIYYMRVIFVYTHKIIYIFL